MHRPALVSMFAGLVAFVVAAARINHGLVDSSWPAGPGLTTDESFNLGQGVYLFDAALDHGPLLLTPSGIRAVFGDARYMPDYPPLGRLVLGAAHGLTAWAIPGSQDCVFNVPAARLGSCLAFAVMIGLLSEFARRRQGHVAALIVAVLVIGMPQALGHARIASVESPLNLAWIAALLPLLSWWTGDAPPTNRQAVVSGLLWGLLLLTKVQGILLPPIVFAWAAWRFRERMARPLMIWTAVGAMIFLVGWPWLWLDPLRNLRHYLGGTVDRPTLYCWYLGERFADKDVPWHYPFVMTAAAIPLAGLLAMLGLNRKSLSDRVDQLLLLTIVAPLLVFALPGTPVYDGSRLFAIVLPVTGLFLARQLAALLSRLTTRVAQSGAMTRSSSWLLTAAVLPLLVILGSFEANQSFSVNRYGPLVGGNRGAAGLGLEMAYWPEALNAEFWKQVPEGSTVMVAPVSHQFQLSDYEALVPIVQQRGIRLIPFEYDPLRQKGLLLLLHRLADLRPSLQTDPPGSTRVADVLLGGRELARLIDTTNATWTECP